jgi:hypothetical protein
MMMKVHEGVRYNRNSCKSYPGLVGPILSYLPIRFKDTEAKESNRCSPSHRCLQKLNRERIHVEDEGFNAAESINKLGMHLMQWARKVQRHVRRGQEAPHLGDASISRKSGKRK